MAEPTTRRPGPKPRRYHDPGAGTTLGRLIHVYVAARRNSGELVPITAAGTLGKLRSFADHVGWDTPPARVQRVDVERFLRSLRVGAASRRTYLSNIRTFWRWLLVEGHATADPTIGIPKIRVPKLLPRALRPEDVTRLFERATGDPRLATVLSLMAYEGLRAIEVERLDVADIDWAEREFVVNGKGAHQRRLPLSTETEAALAAYLRTLPCAAADEPVLRLSSGQRLRANYVSRMVSVHMEACGVPGTGHALRHSMAAQMLKGGAHIRAVQQALGHDNIATTSRYLSFMVDDLREAMEKRSYGDLPASPTPVLPAAPHLDAIGPLIDTVAGLVATVARLEARLEGGTHLKPVPERVTCDRCGAEGEKSWMERFHDRLHCPDCGYYPHRDGRAYLARHRRDVHGVSFDAGCPWDQPHEHTQNGHCICPLCRQTSATIVWGDATMATHHARPHARCPDCDRCFIALDRHRRHAHRWSTAS